MAIMGDALGALESITVAGTIRDLPYQWQADDAWKDSVMRPPSAASGAGGDRHADDRVARHATPQYQCPEDVRAADPACPTCVFLE
jgi:hypothetical protein